MSLTWSASALAQPYDISWYTVDGGGGTSAAGPYQVSGTIGQHDAGSCSASGHEIVGGFWAIDSAGAGIPAATITSAVSRKINAAGPGGACDLALVPGVQSEPRQGGVSEVRIAFDAAPGGPGNNPVTLKEQTCAAPQFQPYSGASTLSASVAGNELVVTFTPGLENARTYRLTLGPQITSIPGQFVDVAALIGDVNGDGRVNGTDRSTVVGIWTSAIHFSCSTDLNSSGRTNGTDRSLVVGAWTGPENCAP